MNSSNTKRAEELEKVKKIIENNFSYGSCGIFDTRNIANDPMVSLFKGKYFELDICFESQYFEFFGANLEESIEIYEFYNCIADKFFEKAKGDVKNENNNI